MRNSSIWPKTGSFLRDSSIFLYCGECGILVNGLISFSCTIYQHERRRKGKGYERTMAARTCFAVTFLGKNPKRGSFAPRDLGTGGAFVYGLS